MMLLLKKEQKEVTPTKGERRCNMSGTKQEEKSTAQRGGNTELWGFKGKSGALNVQSAYFSH